MGAQEKTIVDCFTLYTHEELMNLDLSKVHITDSKTINILEMTKKCKEYYHNLMGDNLVPKLEECTDAIASIIATSSNLTHDESLDLLNKYPNIKKRIYEEYFAKKPEFLFDTIDDYGIIIKYCFSILNKILGYTLDRNGNIITSASENVAFSTYKYYDTPPTDNLLTEFENKLCMDIYTFAHYNFSALRLHNQNISLRKFHLAVTNQNYNLLDFDKSEAYTNSVLETLSKPTEYELDEDSVKQSVDTTAPDSTDFFKEQYFKLHIKTTQKRLKEHFASTGTDNEDSNISIELSNEFEEQMDTNNNYARYFDGKIKELIPHTTITEEFIKKKERNEINTFLIKFSYDLLQLPWKSAFNKSKKIDKNLDKGSFLTQIKNLARLYDGLTFNRFDDIESYNAFDYYFKKEYSLGLQNLHYILSSAAKSKLKLTKDTIIQIQKIPLVYSRGLVTDNILNQPDTAIQYQKIIMFVYRLFFLIVYCLSENMVEDRKRLILNLQEKFNTLKKDVILLSEHPNTIYCTCEAKTFSNMIFFTTKDYDALWSNSNLCEIKYRYPYANEFIDMMLFNWEKHFNNYNKVKNHFASLYRHCSTATKKGILEYAAIHIPNTSLPEL